MEPVKLSKVKDIDMAGNETRDENRGRTNISGENIPGQNIP